MGSLLCIGLVLGAANALYYPAASLSTHPPALAGQFISLIKDSSIVSVISIQELTFQGTELMTSTLLTMEIRITVTILYLLLTLPCSLLVARVEQSMARSLR